MALANPDKTFAFDRDIPVNKDVLGTQLGIAISKGVAYAGKKGRSSGLRPSIQGGMVAFAADSVMGTVMTGDTADRVCVDLGEAKDDECFRVMGVIFQDGGGEGYRSSSDRIAVQVGGTAVMCNTSNMPIAQGEKIYVIPGKRFIKKMGHSRGVAFDAAAPERSFFQMPVIAGESSLNVTGYAQAKKMRVGKALSAMEAGKYGLVQLAH